MQCNSINFAEGPSEVKVSVRCVVGLRFALWVSVMYAIVSLRCAVFHSLLCGCLIWDVLWLKGSVQCTSMNFAFCSNEVRA